MNSTSSTPPLSIVISNRHAWPGLRECFEILLPQARAVGAEVIVSDSTGAGLPPDFENDPALRGIVWLNTPGNSVFQLRAHGLMRASAPIIAITEDHCLQAPDWCEAILRAHREFPEAAAIGGVVENGTDKTLIDCAAFFCASGPFLAPIPLGPARRISLQANISYKRNALPETFPETGIVELLFNDALVANGRTLVADPRILVLHCQSHPIAKTCRLHYHNGRTIAGVRLAGASVFRRLARLASCVLIPPYILARNLAIPFQKKRLAGRMIASAPAQALLLACHAAGELTGCLFGPGQSPNGLD